jgi:hypothetical protein
LYQNATLSAVFCGLQRLSSDFVTLATNHVIRDVIDTGDVLMVTLQRQIARRAHEMRFAIIHGERRLQGRRIAFAFQEAIIIPRRPFILAPLE